MAMAYGLIRSDDTFLSHRSLIACIVLTVTSSELSGVSYRPGRQHEILGNLWLPTVPCALPVSPRVATVPRSHLGNRISGSVLARSLSA